MTYGAVQYAGAAYADTAGETVTAPVGDPHPLQLNVIRRFYLVRPIETYRTQE